MWKVKVKDMPKLIILCGLPGSGKSTVGRLIAKRLDAIILQSDLIRRELFPQRTYSSDESKAVYKNMLAQAKTHLTANATVILDATFLQNAHRAVPIALAEELKVAYQIVHVVSTPELTKERLDVRLGDPSEASYEIYLHLREQFEEIKIAHILIENVGDFSELERQVRVAF